MDGWNPQKEDFSNRSFNPNIGSRHGKTEFALYVVSIPMELNEDGVKNLFAACGSVNYVKLLPPKFPQGGRAGFVHYNTLREAERAIKELNKFKVGDNCLRVQWAKPKREKEPVVDDDKYRSLLKKLELGPLIQEDLNDLIKKVDEGDFRNPLLKDKNNTESFDQESTDTHDTPVAPIQQSPPIKSAFPFEKQASKSSLISVNMPGPEGQQDKKSTLTLPSLFERFKSGDEVKLTVVEVAPNEGTLICQMQSSETKEKMEMLHKELNRHYMDNEKHLLIRPAVGMVCATLFSEDNSWYRVVVEEVLDDNKARVKYVDHGNIESVQLSELYALEKEFFKMPAFSIPCQIKGMKSWTDQVTKSIVNAAMENGFNIKVSVHQVVNDTLVGDVLIGGISMLKSLSPKTDIQQSMNISDNVSKTKKSISTAPPESSPEVSPSRPDISSSEVSKIPETKARCCEQKLPEGNFEIVVSHVESPNSFYCQVINESLFKFIEKIKFISDGSNLISLKEAPKVGYLCAAMYLKENAWNRAEVLACAGDTVKVLFIDYGNTEVVSRSLIKQLPKELIDVPRQAFEATLSDCESNEEWSSEFLVEFKKLENCVCSATVVESILGNGKVVLDLHNELNELIKDTMQKKSNLVPASFTPKQPPIGKEMDIYITAADTSGFVYCQMAEDLHHFAEMNKKMENYLEKYQVSDKMAFTPNEVCAVKSRNGHWYRAVIQELAGDVILVQYVDFGCLAQVKKSQIFSLSHELCEEASFAVKCQLLDAKPAEAEVWSDKFVATCKELKGVTVNAKFDSKQGDNYIVKIPKLLNMLIAKNCAEYC